jgi:hypothetical protein
MSERLAKIAAAKLLAKEYDSYSATQLGRLPAAEYARLRQGKVDVGELPQESGYRSPGLRITHYEQTPGEPLSDRELALMLQFPKQDCEKFYKPNTQLNDQNFIIGKKSEQERENIRNASILHGVIPGTVRFRVPEVKPAIVDDERVNAGELGKLAGLPPDARVTTRQYNDLLDADARRLASRNPEQIAQDRVVELRREADRVAASLEKPKA